jgi:inosine-uridine nucleoside N-ribohydrolase
LIGGGGVIKTVLVDIGAGAKGAAALVLLGRTESVRIAGCTLGDPGVEVPAGLETALGTVLPILAPRTADNAPAAPKGGLKAWDLIFRCALEGEGSLELVTLGALTNLAVTLIKYPETAGRIKRVLLLGGGTENGDITAFAEKNIYHDPCAADIVFKSGVPILMCGLNVTRNLSGADPFFEGALEKSGDFDLKEALPAAAVLSDRFYTARPCFIGIERVSPLTMGMTVCDIFGKEGRKANAGVMVSIDRASFLELLRESLKEGR